MLSLNSSSANRRLFHSAPLAHCAVSGCLLFIVRQGTSMSHRGNHGWGVFTSSKMTTLSRTCRCKKWTRIAVLVVACPGHTSTGQIRGPPLSGNAMRYIRGSFPIGQGFPYPSLLCRLPMLCHPVPRQRSRRYLLPALPALDPSLLSLPEGGSISRHPSPVCRLLLVPCHLAWVADHSDCLPGISPQSHPIEQANQGTKCTLDPA